jgi:hypothetical protein
MADNERRGFSRRLGNKLSPRHSRSRSSGNAPLSPSPSRASNPTPVFGPDSQSPVVEAKVVRSAVPTPLVSNPDPAAPVASKSAPPQPGQTEIIVPSPPLISTASLKASTQPHLTLEEERSALWKRAYHELKKEKPRLIQNYETILADTGSNPNSANVLVGDSSNDEEARLS